MPPAEKRPQDSPDDGTLKRLERELYAKEEGQELKMRRKELSLLGKRLSKTPTAQAEVETTFANVASLQARRRRRLLIGGAAVGLLAIIFIVAVFVTLRFRASRQVATDQIGIEVQGPTDVTAGSEATYRVAFHNDSHVNWNNVDIVLHPADGFRVTATSPEAEGSGHEFIWRVGSVAQGQSGEVSVTGHLLGEDGAVAVTEAEITLTPENFPSGRFSKTALATTRVSALPIEVSLDAAGGAGSGERIRGVIRVRNLGAEELSNAVLKVAPAPGMELAPEDPEFSTGFSALTGEWSLEPIPPLGELTRTIIFTVTGQPGERRVLEIQLGVREGEEVFVQRKISHVVAISASELTIEQLYNGSAEPQTVFPEETIQGVLNYTNVGSVGMKNVIVRAKFEGTGLNASRLQLPKGAFDPVTQTIAWSSASVPELSVVQPGEEGKLEFQFTILPASEFPLGGENVKNFTLVSTATIDSEDLPTPAGQEKKVISDRAVLSIGSELSLSATAFYDDGRLGIKSTGPVPPKVGQTTTYTIQVHFGSALNDVGEARMVAVLPDGVGYTGKTIVSKGSVEFNDRSREVIWQIPLLEGLTGRARPAEELHFQVSVTPGANVVGRSIPFLNKLMGDGQDLFVDETVSVEAKDLPTTETASQGKGQVES